MSELVVAYNVEARTQAAWFSMVENSYYAGKMQVFAVNVKRTKNGEFFVDVSNVSKPYNFTVGYRSNAFATEADARADANRVWLAVRDEFITEHGMRASAVKVHDDENAWCSGMRRGAYAYDSDFIAGSGTPVMADGSKGYDRDSFCPTCEHFGTVSVSLQAYGNVTDCSACKASTYTSIGD